MEKEKAIGVYVFDPSLSSGTGQSPGREGLLVKGST